MIKMIVISAFLLMLFGSVFLILIFHGTPRSFIASQEMVTSQVDHSLNTKQYSQVSLEKIFDNQLENIPETEKITLMVTGDVIPSRSVNYQATVKNDFLWPYRGIAETVADADITFINLETPLMRICPITMEGMVFCGSNKHIEGLKLMGVDVATIANNHAGNHGINGVTETKVLLESNDIRVTGAGSFVVREVKGIKFAFLGFNDISGGIKGLEDANEEAISSQIAEARKVADVVIVQYHWGAEYRAQPDKRQQYLGHFTIDAGADMVLSNHPHWVQPVEIYKDKVIMYAHGNTIFDQEWSEATKRGVLGKYVFAGKQLVDIEYIPIGLRNFGESYLAEGDLRTKILDGLQKESETLARARQAKQTD